jgi:hypothetical protein
MEEIWKGVPLSIYSVSNFGRIRSNNYNKTGCVKIMKLAQNRYSHLTMWIGGERKNILVHRLVAEYFVDGRSIVNNVVNHKDKNTHNNNFENLEWVSMLENNTHRLKDKKMKSKFTGVTKSGVKNRVRWVAQISIGKIKKNLGTHDTEEQAHQAYLKFLSDNNIQNKYATT